MVEWLGGYLQQLIIIILIATFLELLLPNSTFERYVRLVLGLLILFLIMKPAFSIFNNQIDWDRWFVAEGEEVNLPSLHEIQADAENLKREQTEFIHKQASEQIEQQTRALLAQKFKSKPTEVVATIGEIDGRPKLKELRIELSEHRDQPAWNEQSAVLMDEPTDEKEERVYVDREQIAIYLAHYWGLEAHQLEIT